MTPKENGKHFTDMKKLVEDTTERVDRFLRRPHPWEMEIQTLEQK